MKGKTHEENTFLKIRSGKIATMKKIFREMGEEISPYAKITGNELVSGFDLLNELAEEEDTESIDNAMWGDFLENMWENLSAETKKKLKKCKKVLILNRG